MVDEDKLIAGAAGGEICYEGTVDGLRASGTITDRAAPQARKNGKVDANDPTTWGKVSRNAACPCGSGKKFKMCHGTGA